MNITSIVTLLLIVFFYAWRVSNEEKSEGESILKRMTPSFKRGSGFMELVLFLTFLGLYKLSRYVAKGDEMTAFANARWIVDLEKKMGIYYEVPIQQWFLDKIELMKFVNQVYIELHIPATIIFFVWLFHKQKKEYTFVRNGFLIANIITIFFFIGFPCAPPRMLNDLGFVDTLLEISHINLYKGNISKIFNPYAAVPSMHFGNALLIAVVGFWLQKNKFMKWIMVFYPALVLLIIVITGNHFFMDAIVGGIVVLFPYPLMLFLQRFFPKLKATFWGKKQETQI
jgi:PAP2 superfamily